MALNENSQPRKPSGPECDSSRYTTRPTTKEGKASDVLSSVRTMPRPRKRATASQAPPTMPTLQASRAISRAQVLPPDTHAPLGCTFLLDKKKQRTPPQLRNKA